jgi:hypothetical protein
MSTGYAPVVASKTKILLLQGPVVSNGINFVTSHLYRTPEQRKPVWACFNAEENIRMLSHVFRARGYKVLYSAWREDEAWITQNADLFDGYAVSDQTSFREDSRFMGRVIQNNKEKLYFGCLAGLLRASELFGQDCWVLRMRSDIAVDPVLMDQEILKLEGNPRSVIIEYADPRNPYFVPDFLMLSAWTSQYQLYAHLTDICARGISYHISSHIDHGAGFLKLLEDGAVVVIACMRAQVHMTMVWRGIPRYYLLALQDYREEYVFDCVLQYPAGVKLTDLVRMIPQELSGRA